MAAHGIYWTLFWPRRVQTQFTVASESNFYELYNYSGVKTSYFSYLATTSLDL